jgi:hypothetical protein
VVCPRPPLSAPRAGAASVFRLQVGTNRRAQKKGLASLLGFGRRQRWHRRRNPLRPRIASDLDHRPDQLAVLGAMIMLNLRKLRMNVAASRALRWSDHAQLCE